MSALNINVHRIEGLGGWTASSATLRSTYIDHNYPACQAARFFFGSLIPDATSGARVGL
jgi:hypothetical protein